MTLVAVGPPGPLAHLRTQEAAPVPCWSCAWPLIPDEETDLCCWCTPTWAPLLQVTSPDPFRSELMPGIRTEQLADLAAGILEEHLERITATAAQIAADHQLASTYVEDAVNAATAHLGRLLALHTHIVEQERPVRRRNRYQHLVRVAKAGRG